jgi:hypothetical protein
MTEAERRRGINRPLRAGSALLVAAVAGALVASCGGGGNGVETGSVGQFCSDWARTEAVLADLEPQTADEFRQLRDALAEISYTPEAQDDANTLIRGLDELADLVDDRGGSTADLTPEEQEELTSGLEEYFAASAALADYADDTCDETAPR